MFLLFVVLLRSLVDWIASIRGYRFVILINCENSLGCIRTLYRVTRSRMLFIRSRVRVAMQVMWDRRVDSWGQESWNIRTSDGTCLLVMTKHQLQEGHDFDWGLQHWTRNLTTGRDWFRRWYSSGEKRIHGSTCKRIWRDFPRPSRS